MPGRRRYHHGDLRAALLRTAEEQIVAGGAASFSLRDAARAAGVSPSAVYRHFADRDALLGALAADGFARLTAAMVTAVDAAGHDPMARLAAVGEAYVAFATSHAAVFRLMFGACGARSPAPRGVGTGAPAASYRMLADGLDGLVTAGMLSPRAREGAELPLWSAVHGLAALLVDGPLQHASGNARDTMVRDVIRTAIAGVIHAQADGA